MPIFRLENRVQHYDWGTIDAIPRLLGIENPLRKPYAELWMGAHPLAPSSVRTPHGSLSLADLIARDPRSALGKEAQERFGPSLPFLFKVLSAARALSIQAHPSRRKAASGFERENIAAIPLDAQERNYRDPNHKPEMIVALEGFDGLCGFRPIKDILRIVRAVVGDEHRRIVGNLEDRPGKVELSVLVYRYITLSQNQRQDVLDSLSDRLPMLQEKEKDAELRRILGWTRELMATFPGDIGALAPFVLNIFHLEPGQALFLAPGQIHAYLKGTGLEIMANSDNVLRGGLTSKHVDVSEFISNLTFNPERVHPFEAARVDDWVEEYPKVADEFRLDRIRIARDGIAGRRQGGPEILLCVEGRVEAVDNAVPDEHVTLSRGMSAFVSADTERYTLRGNGLLYRAGVSL